MQAIVEIAAQQYIVRPSETHRVPLLAGNVGDTVTFSTLLAVGEGSSMKVGTPSVSGTVTAKILAHGKDEKVIVFKKKRRKGYRKLNGHRQQFTEIEITNVSAA